jgi:hypothetical protein
MPLKKFRKTERTYMLKMAVITLMTEAVSSSETSVNIYQTTWYYIQVDSQLHTHCHKNFKSKLTACSIYDLPV